MATAFPRDANVPSEPPGEPSRSAIDGEDGGPMGQRQEGVDAVTLRIKAERACASLGRHGLNRPETVAIEDLDEAVG
jgi:hypothetical protein